MKKVIIYTMGVFSLLLLRPAFAEHPDFAGMWKLDMAASTFSDPSNHPTGGTLTITKHHKTVHIAENLAYPHGEKMAEADWRVDDRYHPIDTPSAAGAGEILSKWDRDTLVGERRFNESTEQIRFGMTAAGRLSEEIHHPGMPDMTLVWTKQ